MIGKDILPHQVEISKYLIHTTSEMFVGTCDTEKKFVAFIQNYEHCQESEFLCSGTCQIPLFVTT